MKPFLTVVRRLFLAVALLALVACGGTEPPPPAADSTLDVPELPEPLSTAKDLQSFQIANTGRATLSWKISVQNDPANPQAGDWLAVTPTSGSLAAGKTRDIGLSLNEGFSPGIYRARVTVAYNGGSQAFDVTGAVDGAGATAASFELSSDGFSNSVSPGVPLEIPIFVTRDSNLKGPVTLELFGAPEGVDGRFNPSPVAGDESTLRLSTNGELAPGTYTFSVRGTAGSVTAAFDLSLRVVGDAKETDFNLALSSSSLNLSPGGSQTVTVDVRTRGGFDDAVRLAVDDPPAGIRATFSDNPVTTDAALTLTASDKVAPGVYQLTVKGTSGDRVRQTQLGLTVKATEAQTAQIVGTVTTDNALVDIRAASSSGLSSSGLPSSGALLSSTSAMPEAAFAPSELLVKYHDLTLDPLSAQAAGKGEATARLELQRDVQQRYGLRLLRAGTAGQADLFAVNSDVLAAARELSRDPRVQYAEPNYYLYTQDLPNDSRVNEQWALAAAGLPVAWSRQTGTGGEVVVAVIDSGFALNHPDLRARFLPGYDFCASDKCATTDADPGYGQVANVHGTHVAGILGAAANNGQGIAGAAYGSSVRLLPVKIFGDNGRGTTADVFIRSIRWAAGLGVEGVPNNPHPADIINMSLGGYFQSRAVQDAVNEARAAGALLVAATGNDGLAQVRTPAAAEGVIGVGSVNASFERSCFSNYGAGGANGSGKTDIVAPGGEGPAGANPLNQPKPSCAPNIQGVLSTYPQADYGLQAGTSMATPLVSAVAALILSEEPGLTVAQLEQRLLAASYFDSATMTPDEYGAGVLRAELALGLPGPGAQVTVSAETNGDSAVDAVRLDLYGGSSSFTLDGLKAGRYRVEATTGGTARALSSSATVELSAGEPETLELRLEP